MIAVTVPSGDCAKMIRSAAWFTGAEALQKNPPHALASLGSNAKPRRQAVTTQLAATCFMAGA
jgi:hypothetical protein